MYQRVAFGEPKAEFADAHIHDVNRFEWIAWTPLLIAIVVFGVFPDLIFKLTNPGVTRMVFDFHRILGS
jgi:NADH-quinone oxidoreductase subunit M